jgi:hypothetical protein
MQPQFADDLSMYTEIAREVERRGFRTFKIVYSEPTYTRIAITATVRLLRTVLENLTLDIWAVRLNGGVKQRIWR